MIDLRTLFILLTVISGIMFLTFIIYFHNKKSSFNIITWLLLSLTVSNVLFGLRNIIPDYLSMTLASALLSLTYSLSYMAVCRFLSLTVNKWVIIIPIILIVLVIQPQYSYITRIVLSNPVYAAQNIILLYVLVKIFYVRKSKAVLLLIIFCLVGFTAFFARAVTSILFKDQHVNLLESSVSQSIIFTMLCVGLFLFVIGILLLQMESESELLIQSNLDLDKTNKNLHLKEMELIKLNEELIIARDNALSSSRAKSAFLSNMGHEMRTPMNAIIGFCEIIKMKHTNPDLKHYVEAIEINGNILIQLINDILDIIKFETNQFILRKTQVNLKQIVNEIPHYFDYKLSKKNLKMIIHIDDDFPFEIEADPLRLRQIMINLAGNAVKFTPSGQVNLTIKHKFIENDTKINLEIIVTDTGKGISPEKQKQIFDAFEQEENYSGNYGLGLGLTITKKIVNAMNGTVNIESVPDNGSTFTVFLPGLSVTNKMNHIVYTENSGNNFAEKLIMIVDDEPNNLDLLQQFLENEGYHTISASGGIEALEKLKSVTPDLIIMDIKMSGMNGFETSRTIKSNPQLCNIPIIALTGMLLSEEDSKMVGIKFSSIVNKPYTRKKIIEEIAMLI